MYETGGTKMSEKEQDTFFKEGAENYINALRVIRDYEGFIQKIAATALSKKIKLLSDAMQLVPPLDSKTIQPYLNQDLDNGCAGVGVTILLPSSGGLYALYALVYFDDKGIITAFVSLELLTAESRDKVMTVANKVEYIGSEFVNNAPEYEVYVEKPIDQADQATLAETFEFLLDLWINFWKTEDIKKVLGGI